MFPNKNRAEGPRHLPPRGPREEALGAPSEVVEPLRVARVVGRKGKQDLKRGSRFAAVNPSGQTRFGT